MRARTLHDAIIVGGLGTLVLAGVGGCAPKDYEQIHLASAERKDLTSRLGPKCASSETCLTAVKSSATSVDTITVFFDERRIARVKFLDRVEAAHFGLFVVGKYEIRTEIRLPDATIQRLATLIGHAGPGVTVDILAAATRMASSTRRATTTRSGPPLGADDIHALRQIGMSEGLATQVRLSEKDLRMQDVGPDQAAPLLMRRLATWSPFLTLAYMACSESSQPMNDAIMEVFMLRIIRFGITFEGNKPDEKAWRELLNKAALQKIAAATPSTTVQCKPWTLRKLGPGWYELAYHHDIIAPPWRKPAPHTGERKR